MMKTLHALLVRTLALSPLLPAVSAAQEGTAREAARDATGGAQTLEDILARQRGERIDDAFRRDATGSPDSAAAIAAQLGTLGGVSDAEIFRALLDHNLDIAMHIEHCRTVECVTEAAAHVKAVMGSL